MTPKLADHYIDPRLVDLYDLDNPRGADTDFYLRLAKDLNARSIIDLGCGTGTLAIELAERGFHVTGIDPSASMLAVARRKPGADRVCWLEGDASALGSNVASLVLMTGNVAQVFLEDADWEDVLRRIYIALRPGGHLAFETRNPEVRAWEGWTRATTYTEMDTPHGPLECWMDITRSDNGRVLIEGHNVFKATGEDIVAQEELRFRSYAEVQSSLMQAGFNVEQVYGSWQSEDFTPSSRFMVFIARRP